MLDISGLGIAIVDMQDLFLKKIPEEEVPFGGFETYFSFLGFQIISYNKLVRC